MCQACRNRICLYCHTAEHRTKECTKTERGKKIIADKKNFCCFCFVQSVEKHLPNKKSGCTDSSCDGWYSNVHHMVFCKERIKGLLSKKLFLPKIDQNLWQRFAATFEFDEQYALALSSPIAENYFAPKHVKIIENSYGDYDWKDSPPNSSNSDGILVITHRVRLYSPISKKFLKKLDSKQVICKARDIELVSAKISADHILQLLSSYTKDITLQKLKSDITFTEIIKNAPNIEGIYIWDHKSVTMNEETWLDDLMKYKIGSNLRGISLALQNIEFDIKKMDKFIRTKCANDVSITICSIKKQSLRKFKLFGDKLATYFIEEENGNGLNHPRIELVKPNSEYRTFTLRNTEVEASTSSPRSKKRRIG